MLALAGAIAAVPMEGAAADTKASASSVRGDIRALQRKVGVAADGIFGPATERALKRWQRRHGLVADGIAGPQTRSAMGLGSGPVLKRTRTHARRAGGARHRSHGGGGVRSLQRRIGVPADGVFGPATEAALKRWQAAHGLVPDGIAGPRTRAKLGLGPGPVLKRRSGGSAGRGGGRIHRLVRAANRIAGAPYKYGGGHGTYHDSGYDCSGSVSYALHGAKLLNTQLTSGDFERWGTAGAGQWVTIYANGGHVYMLVAGLRFDTSGLSSDGSRWHTSSRSTSGYVVRHPTGL
jgi:peptidoglycan hydrolase-like protein with peptidoglycan-binding domain